MAFVKFFLYAVHCLSLQLTTASPSDFDFSPFAGYTLETQILIEDCQTNMSALVNQALCGNSAVDCIELPTVNTNLTHVDCAEDELMNHALRLTIYKDDDDVTGFTDRQRLEMKVFARSPEELKATQNSNFIYACNFFKHNSCRVLIFSLLASRVVQIKSDFDCIWEVLAHFPTESRRC